MSKNSGFPSRTREALLAWGESRLMQRKGVEEDSPAEPLAGFGGAGGESSERGRKLQSKP